MVTFANTKRLYMYIVVFIEFTSTVNGTEHSMRGRQSAVVIDSVLHIRPLKYFSSGYSGYSMSCCINACASAGRSNDNDSELV